MTCVDIGKAAETVHGLADIQSQASRLYLTAQLSVETMDAQYTNPPNHPNHGVIIAVTGSITTKEASPPASCVAVHFRAPF